MSCLLKLYQSHVASYDLRRDYAPQMRNPEYRPYHDNEQGATNIECTGVQNTNQHIKLISPLLVLNWI